MDTRLFVHSYIGVYTEYDIMDERLFMLFSLGTQRTTTEQTE